jgi:hypothetical protein
MFCVALCMALSAQMTIVVLDRLKHTFQIDHAPTELAGPVFDHGHHLKVDVQHSPVDTHAQDHDAAVAHVHHTDEANHSARHMHAHEHGPVTGHVHHADDADHSTRHAHAHNPEGQSAQGFHTHEWLPEGHDHGPITHHHHGSGMLTPWLVSTPLQIADLPLRIPVLDYGILGHPDAPAWRRDRPPKLSLERIV